MALSSSGEQSRAMPGRAGSQPASTDLVPRPARSGDLDLLRAVEADSDTAFPAAVDPEWPAPSDGQERAAVPGFILVVGEPVIGFVHVLDLGAGHVHLEQLSVRADAQRQGLGSALVTAAVAEAARHGATTMTLMTYADVPWNAPFYAALGFVEADPRAVGLDTFVEAEERFGLARWGRRVAMVRQLGEVSALVAPEPTDPESTPVTPDPAGPGVELPDVLTINDPVRLRALSHPTRLMVLTELALLGRANVAMVADQVGEPANSVSYHLSVLAKHGLVVPADPPAEATRRERWWRIGSQSGIAFHTEDEALLRPLSAAVATWRGELAADWSDRMVRSSEAAEARGLPSKQSTFGVWLTPDEARAAAEQITTALQPLRDRFHAQRTRGLSQPPAEGMDYYRIDALMFPDLTRVVGSSEEGGDSGDQSGA